MNKKYIILGIILFIIGIAGGIYLYNVNNSYENNDTNYNVSKTSTEQNISKNNVENVESENFNTNTESSNSTSSQSVENSSIQEIEISSFSTKIYTKDSERQNNISIACSTLNGTIVENGSTFSFCNTVGKATSSKGYEKADVFQDGNVVEALGGGICQVSTTLYNAVLKVSNLDITERHEHSNSVPYIKDGQDAAVAYGSYDFKFINNTGNAIKISAENSSDQVTIKLYK